MLKTELFQKDPEMGQRLLCTTSKIVDLARIAIADNQEQKEPSSPPIEEVVHQEILESRSVSTSPSQQRQPSRPPQSQDEPPYFPTPTRNLFGNGWFDFSPPNSPPIDEPITTGSDSQPLTFGLRLIHTNLQVAYHTLISDPTLSTPLIRQMFKYALLYHTREEILRNLRWFLTQGPSVQKYLGRAVFGFDASLSLQHLNMLFGEVKPRVLNPLVDAEAMVGEGGEWGWGWESTLR